MIVMPTPTFEIPATPDRVEAASVVCIAIQVRKAFLQRVCRKQFIITWSSFNTYLPFSSLNDRVQRLHWVSNQVLNQSAF